jgi:hypothetical protein
MAQASLDRGDQSIGGNAGSESEARTTMNRVYLECASTGKWLFRETVDDIDQPHLLRLAMLGVGDDDKSGLLWCSLIKPEPGWHIDETTAVGHGITHAQAEREGLPIAEAMKLAQSMIQRAGAGELIAYNLDFHLRMLLRGAHDADASFDLPSGMQTICAMREATPIVKKPRMGLGGGWSWPKHTEALAYFGLGQSLPSVETDPVQRGLALVRSVRTIYEGILAHHIGEEVGPTGPAQVIEDRRPRPIGRW